MQALRFHLTPLFVIMEERTTKWFGMRVTPAQKAKIERLAEQHGSIQKAAVLEAVERSLSSGHADSKEEPPIEAQPGSFLEAAGDLIGSIDDPDVPTDLSSNPKHMKDHGKD